MIIILMNRRNLSAAINPVIGDFLYYAVRFFVAGLSKAKKAFFTESEFG